jgi:hypothetical protein
LKQRHEEVLAHLKQRDTELAAASLAARRELAAVYLTSLSDEAFATVGKLTGFQGLERRDPRPAMEHERHVLETAIVKLEADDRYQRRALLVGDSGTLTQERDLAAETLAPLQTACERFEQLPDFTKLVELGYDTPRFAVKWWQPSYWKYWAAGDRICKELGFADFGDDVLPAYEQHAGPRDIMRDEVQRLTKAIDDVHALVQEHDRLVHRATNLEAIYLEEAQDFLGEHLANADGGLLEQWAQGDPARLRAVQVGVRKLAGIAAKREILLDMMRVGLPQVMEQLEQRRTKLVQKANKFERPKHAYRDWPDDVVDPRFDERSTAMQGQVDKLQRRVDVLVANDRYAGFDMRNDPHLWWWYFMQTQPPRYAPRYQEYYQRHTDIQMVTDPAFETADTTSDALAAALIAGSAEQGEGYLS